MPRGASRPPRRLTKTARRSPPVRPTSALPEVKIAPEGEHRPRADGDDALLPALAADLGLVRQQIEVLEVHPAQLGEPDAGGVEQLQDGEVARRGEVVALGPRLGPVEQGLGLLAVHVGRQPLVQLGHPAPRGRRCSGPRGAPAGSGRGSAPPRARAPPSAWRARAAAARRGSRAIPSRSTVVQVQAPA